MRSAIRAGPAQGANEKDNLKWSMSFNGNHVNINLIGCNAISVTDPRCTSTTTLEIRLGIVSQDNWGGSARPYWCEQEQASENGNYDGPSLLAAIDCWKGTDTSTRATWTLNDITSGSTVGVCVRLPHTGGTGVNKKRRHGLHYLDHSGTGVRSCWTYVPQPDAVWSVLVYRVGTNMDVFWDPSARATQYDVE